MNFVFQACIGYRRPVGLATVALLVCAVVVTTTHAKEATKVASPDGKIVVTVGMTDDGAIEYHADYGEVRLIEPSRLGLGEKFRTGFELTGTSQLSHSSEWHNPLGELSTVPNVYNELHVKLKHSTGALLQATVRTYDEGLAFRYELPEQDEREFDFEGEFTEFHFPAGTTAYEEHGTEGTYERVDVTAIKPQCERPLTVEYKQGTIGVLTEASNHHYPRMLLSPLEGKPGTLVSHLGGTSENFGRTRGPGDPSIHMHAGETTPWRVLIVGDSPGEVLENNYLLLNLNPPNALADTSWIKPGKVMRSGLSSKDVKAIIDFAPTIGISYVHLDAGWYGHERDPKSDASSVSVPDLDMEEIIAYGRERDIGVTVYVNKLQLKAQRDRLFALFEEWGLAGIKFGFIPVGPQEETTWITESVKKAAEHKILVNIHDAYRTTGNTRTLPNLMTVEGIHGNEQMPTAKHNCTLPFTRYTQGVGDYTVCYYNNRIKTTHAHQLAMNVISFSPLQWILWYDSPKHYKGEPEIEFFREVPTAWDETKVLAGEIGKYAVLARRSGERWFVGTVNAEQARTLEILLDFLKPGTNYTAHLYSDDESVDTRTKVRIDVQEVTSDTTLKSNLVVSGGQAIWIHPTDEGE